MKKLLVILVCLLSLAGCQFKKHKQGDDRSNNEFYSEYVRIYKSYGSVPLDTTETALKAYLVKFPNNHQAWAFMAKVYMDRGLYDSAETSYRTSLHYNAKYAPAMSGLGTLYSWTGRVDSAQVYLNSAVANGDSSYYTYISLAIADIKKRDTAGARQIIKRVPVDSLNDELLAYTAVISTELRDEATQRKAMANLKKHAAKDSLLDLYSNGKIKALGFFDEKRKQRNNGK